MAWIASLLRRLGLLRPAMVPVLVKFSSSSSLRLRNMPGRTFLTVIAVMSVMSVCLLGEGEAFGCPNCKDAVNTSDPEGLNLARGYFYSILIMLAMPCTLISSFGIYVWREMQRQKQTGTASPEHSVDASIGQPSYQPIAPPHS
jgi:hypothetical protein